MKSCLLFADYQTDYSADGILAGFYENPDWDISEVPRLAHVRGGTDQGYDLPGEPGKGLTGTPEYMSNPLPESRHSPEDILDNAKNYDLIVLLSYRDYALRAFQWFIEKTGLSSKDLPLVVLDGEDHSQINRHIIERTKTRLYFKREMLKEDREPGYDQHLGCEVWPLPFSAFTRSYPNDIDDQQKEYDLFLSLGMTHPSRIALTKGFLEFAVDNGLRHYIAMDTDAPMRSHPYYSHMQGRLDWFGYLRKQAQAKIGASVRGYGRDALHFWELMSFETACLYAEPGIWIPYPPQDGIHCLFIKEDCSDVKKNIEVLLVNDLLRIFMARKGKEWLYQHHTNFQRVKYLIEIAMKVLGGEKIQKEEYGL